MFVRLYFTKLTCWLCSLLWCEAQNLNGWLLVVSHLGRICSLDFSQDLTKSSYHSQPRTLPYLNRKPLTHSHRTHEQVFFSVLLCSVPSSITGFHFKKHRRHRHPWNENFSTNLWLGSCCYTDTDNTDSLKLNWLTTTKPPRQRETDEWLSEVWWNRNVTISSNRFIT